MWQVLFVSLMLFTSAAEAATDADRQFAFLELQRSLREEPRSARTPSRLFGLGEYYFRAQNFGLAERCFLEADIQVDSGAQTILTKIYLAEIARLQKGDPLPDELRRLKQALSQKHFFSVFGETNRYRWTSELKNDYELQEHVDRMEVYLNGTLFYTISLP